MPVYSILRKYTNCTCSLSLDFISFRGWYDIIICIFPCTQAYLAVVFQVDYIYIQIENPETYSTKV